MDSETIILGIGIIISLGLGVINLLWRREKVVVINSEVYPEFLIKGTRIDTKLNMEPFFLRNAALSVEASCELVLISGQRDIEVREVEVRLDRRACEELKAHFELPHRNRLFLFAEPKNTPNALLQMKRSVRFAAERLFDSTEEFRPQYGEIGTSPNIIQPLFDKLETKCEICWTRYDGKQLCWRFPQRWWRNLGKKLWG